jgi:hypothetical protein
MSFGRSLHGHGSGQSFLLLNPVPRVVHVSACNSFTTRCPLQQQSKQRSRYAATRSATSEAGQAQGSSQPAADAGKLFSELADACSELKRAPPSMVQMSI